MYPKKQLVKLPRIFVDTADPGRMEMYQIPCHRNS